MKKSNKKDQPLSDTAAALEKKHYIANLKQNYGLRKDMIDIKHFIDDLKTQIDSSDARPKHL